MHGHQRIRVKLADINAHRVKQPRADAVVVPEHRQQQMLRTHRLAVQLRSQPSRFLQNTLRPRRKSGPLLDRGAALRRDQPVDHPGQLLRRHAGLGQNLGRRPSGRLKQSGQQVLCAGIALAVIDGRPGRILNCLSCFFRIVILHFPH